MANLSIADLFTPAPSGVDPTNTQAAPASGSWLATAIDAGATIGLSTTTWQPGDPTRTLLAILAVIDAQQDGLVSLMAQGGFLDWAATGTVTYETTAGVTVTQYVTPDPSILSQNPTGAPGWLDVLAYEVYNVEREQATYASGSLYLVNESGSTYNYATGTFHVANALTTASPPPTYANTTAIALTPSPTSAITNMSVGGGGLVTVTCSTAGIFVGEIVFLDHTGTNLDGLFQTITNVGSTTVQFLYPPAAGSASTGTLYVPAAFPFQADVVGPGSNAVAGGITTLVTSQVGIESYNATSFIGNNWESNASVVNRCRLSLAALSPSGPSGAYQYFALTAFQLYADTPIDVTSSGGGTTPITLNYGAITRASVALNKSIGIVTTTIANANGTTDGSTSNPIFALTATSPIAVTVTNPHGMVTGDYAYIAGVQGLTGADGYWEVTVTGTPITGYTFTLNGSTGTGVYTTGGTAECGDLGMVDLILQNNVVPDCLSEITQWAGSTTVALTGTVYVPAAQVTSYQAALSAILATYFATVPLGGVVNVESSNVIPLDAMIGLLYSAGIPGQGQASYVSSISGVQINGVASDLSISSTNIPVLTNGIAGITIVGV